MIEAMKQALKALETLTDCYDDNAVGIEIDAITALRQAIAEAGKQEPVDWKRLYELEKKKKEAIQEKYERDIAKLPCIIPMEAEKQEPWGVYCGHRLTPDGTNEFWGTAKERLPEGTKLYTYPPKREQAPVECMCGICKLGKREWVGLTDEDILDALQPHYEEWEASELLDVSSEDYKLIEAKLKEKNT